MLRTSRAVAAISISPVAILGLSVPAGRARTLPVTVTTHSLRRAAARSKSSLGKVGGVKDGLGAAFAVADVNEDQAAQVAPGMDPAGEDDGLSDVCRAQLVAMMGAFHVVWG